MESQSHKIAKVYAKAWLDPDYMKRLKSDPKSVLTEAGIPAKATVQVHEDSDTVTHFVLPKRPAELKDEDLKSDKVHINLCCTGCF